MDQYAKTNRVPLLPKVLIALFLAILIPVYWANYGPENFLWLSDIGLFLTALSLWFEAPLLMSIALIGIFPFEVAWNVDYFVQLFTGYSTIGLANYMFDANLSVFLRSLSLFHVVMPLIWIWGLKKWGYDKRAIFYAPFLVWIILAATYFCTSPSSNINRVFISLSCTWHSPSCAAWFIALMLALPTCMQWPMHELLKRKVKPVQKS